MAKLAKDHISEAEKLNQQISEFRNENIKTQQKSKELQDTFKEYEKQNTALSGEVDYMK